MKAEKIKLSKSLKSIYTPDLLWRVFFYNSLIAAAIIIISTLVEGRFRLSNVIINFVFSHLIGWSITLPLQFLQKKYEHLSAVLFSFMVFIAILVFSLIASLSGYFMLFGWIYPELQTVELWQLLLFNLVLAFFFGLLALIYFSIRDKLEKTINKLKEQEIEKERLKQMQKSSELEALRSKLDPHFLFNTLNSIASLIRMEPDKAERMVEKLSALFRYTLTSGERKTVPLEDEIIVIKNYLEIEKIRLEARLNYQIDIDQSLYNWPVPPLLIQPIVENSIIHGIGKKIEGGIIRIEAKETEQGLQIRISDNGDGFDYNDSLSGFGLKSIKDRLNILYKNRARIKIEKKDGTVTTISLPNEGKNEI